MNNTQKPKQFVLLSASTFHGKYLSLFKKKNTWFYIGTDYNNFLKWKTALEAVGTYVSLSKDIENYGLRLRQYFLDYIAEMSAKNNSLSWWVSSLADKDPSGSDFYLSVCLLSYFNEKMDSIEDESVIIAEDPFFLDSFASLSERHGNSCISCYRGEKPRTYIRLYYRLLGRAVKFLFRSAYELWAARKAGAAPPIAGENKERMVIVRTWVNDNCFRDDGSFKDIYFGRLVDWLQEVGYTVWLIPEKMRLSKSVKSVFEYYKKYTRYRFLLTEDFLGIGDYFRCLMVGIKGMVSTQLVTEFQGIDIAPLLKRERLQYGLHGMKMVRYYYFCKRLRDAGIHPKQVILTFENKFMDKTFIMGIKHYLPDTITTGYQHCAHYPLLLNFFTCDKEIPYLPLPDAIITSGDSFRRILEAEGFPMERVITGSALQFEYLYREQVRTENISDGRKSVLVILPADLRTVIEITLCVRAALNDAADIDVLLKVHPAQRAAIAGILTSFNMPQHFKVITESISSLVMKTDVAVSIGATTAEFEIISAGIPLIRLRRELGFTFSPWIEGYEKTTSSSELRERVYYMLRLSAKEREALKEKGREVIDGYFAPVSEERMRLFIASEVFH